LKDYIGEVDIDEDAGRLSCKLKNGGTIFIRYNNYNKYSYVILFSKMYLDRVRFDNFDDRWDVKTKPNHCHPRYEEKAQESPFNGIPSKDIIILTKLIKSNEIYSFGSK